MTEMKLVVLPDGSEHEVPENHNWLAMDRDCAWWSYLESVRAGEFSWWRDCPQSLDGLNSVRTIFGPFEPGHWTTQLYWIGD